MSPWLIGTGWRAGRQDLTRLLPTALEAAAAAASAPPTLLALQQQQIVHGSWGVPAKAALSTSCSTQLGRKQRAVAATGTEDDTQPPTPHLLPHIRSRQLLNPMPISSGLQDFTPPDLQLVPRIEQLSRVGKPATAAAFSPQLPATLAQHPRQLLGLGSCWGLAASYAAPVCWQQARAASTVRGGAGQPQRPLPLRRSQAMKLELLSPESVSSGLQAVNAAYKAVTGEDLPARAASSIRFKQPDQRQQRQLVECIKQLGHLVGPHHLRDLVRSSINVLLVQPETAELKLRAWGGVLGMDREEVLQWMGGMSMRSQPARHPLVHDTDELIDRLGRVGAELALPQPVLVQMVRSAYNMAVGLTVDRVSRTWAALSDGPFLQHPPWLQDWLAAAPSSKALFLSCGPGLSDRLEYLVQVGQQGSWSLSTVAFYSAKKWDKRFPGYAARAEQLAQARGPAQPAVVAPNQAPEQVVQLFDQEYQRVTGGAQLPGKAYKGGLARWLAVMAMGRPVAAWMSTVTAMIEEVGLEATIALVNTSPLVIFNSPNLLAEQLREYGQLMGWGREKVLMWLRKPSFSWLLTKKPGSVINTARDYAAHAGLSEQDMLHLLDTYPTLFTISIATMKARWSTLQVLQASHPSWAQQWGGYGHNARTAMATLSLHRLRYLSSTGQQGKVAMITALYTSAQKFQSKFPTYAPPLTEEKKGVLGVIEAAHELQLRLAQCPSWDRGWQGLTKRTQHVVLAIARNPQRLGRLDYLLERGLEGTTTVGQAMRASDKAWGAGHPEYAVWEQQRARGAETVASGQVAAGAVAASTT